MIQLSQDFLFLGHIKSASCLVVVDGTEMVDATGDAPLLARSACVSVIEQDQGSGRC